MQAFKADWESMIREFGVRRFSLGLQRAVMATSFFPGLADIRKHVPQAIIGNDTWKPSPEDLARRAAGERSYGQGDIIVLWKLFNERRRKLGRKLTATEEEALLAELDRMIDARERKSA